MKKVTNNSKNLKIPIILIVIGVVGLFILNLFSYSQNTFPYPPYTSFEPSGFQNNGERIYFTATSNSGEPIFASMGGMTMRGGAMSCASCHGANGKGGSGRMMMWVFNAPDIRYSILTTQGGHEGEQPYTDERIKRAITQGLDSEGKPLDLPMPVWEMSDEDLNDLIEFLKTLE